MSERGFLDGFILRCLGTWPSLASLVIFLLFHGLPAFNEAVTRFVPAFVVDRFGYSVMALLLIAMWPLSYYVFSTTYATRFGLRARLLAMTRASLRRGKKNLTPSGWLLFIATMVGLQLFAVAIYLPHMAAADNASLVDTFFIWASFQVLIVMSLIGVTCLNLTLKGEIHA